MVTITKAVTVIIATLTPTLTTKPYQTIAIIITKIIIIVVMSN